MEKPRVSAIVTAYNCGIFLRDALNSILAQTLVPDEILVIDDGSTEDLESIVIEYAPQVRYIRQENMGAGFARNTGIEHTSGDLITFLDCDDIWIEDKTEKQVAMFQANPDLVIASGQKLWWNIDSDKKKVDIYPKYRRQVFHREILVSNIVGNPSMVMFRRDALMKAGLFRDFPWGQDWEFWIRLSKQGEVEFVDQPVVIYRWHSGNISRQNQLTRVACLEGISREAISTYRPMVYRPILRARAKSLAWMRTAEYSRRLEKAPVRRVFLAIGALLLSPKDDFLAKLFVLFKVLFGNAAFQNLKRSFKWIKPERGN